MWILITLFAASSQTVRNSLARGISDRISPALNSWSRFAFNLPYSTALVIVLTLGWGSIALTAPFLGFCFLTAISQLLGNVALVSAFQRVNFAESIALHKLEVVFAALVGVAFFAEFPSSTGWVGILICGAGVLLINLGRSGRSITWYRAFHLDWGAVLALLSGLLLVFASFFLKEASAHLLASNPGLAGNRFVASAHTLFHTTWIEVVVLSLYLGAVRPGEFRKVRIHWRHMFLIGSAGFSGSLAWFWAYSLALVAYVKAVGQVEALFSALIAIRLFRERDAIRQLPGILLLTVGICLVVIGR